MVFIIIMLLYNFDLCWYDGLGWWVVGEGVGGGEGGGGWEWEKF